MTRVHHKNLVSLIGYCKDKKHMALVYEYMHGGNLEDRLRGKLPTSWTLRKEKKPLCLVGLTCSFTHHHGKCFDTYIAENKTKMIVSDRDIC